MSWKLYCDICGNEIEEKTIGHMRVSNFNDGYNTDDYNCDLDICEKCLLKTIGKDVIANGRMEF